MTAAGKVRRINEWRRKVGPLTLTFTPYGEAVVRMASPVGTIEVALTKRQCRALSKQFAAMAEEAL